MNKITHIAALVTGLLIGAGLSSMWPFSQHTGNASKTSTQTVNVSEKQIKTDTITEKRVLPDGTKVQRSVTSTIRNERQNERIKEKHKQIEPMPPTLGNPKNAPISRWVLGIKLVPKYGDWMDMRSYTLSGVDIGRRVGSLPLWGEIGYSFHEGQFTLGIRYEM